MFGVFDFMVPQRLYGPECHRVDPTRHASQPTLPGVAPLAGASDDCDFFSHFSGSLFRHLETTCCFLINMKNDDDEPNSQTWTPLAAATTKLLNELFGVPFDDAVAAATSVEPPKEKDHRSDRNAGEQQKQEPADKQQREYIERRLRELRAFERRARGDGGFKRR